MQALQMAYPIIPTHLARGVKVHLPSDFSPPLAMTLAPSTGHSVVNMYRAANFSIADFILHMSMDLSGEFVDWKVVQGVSIARNKGHMLNLGWRWFDNDTEQWSEAFFFKEVHWVHAFRWLRTNGYVETQADVFSKEGTYKPSVYLVGEFARTLGIKS